MKIFGEPVISMRNESIATLRATISGRRAFDYLPPHPGWRSHYVKRPLSHGVRALYPFPPWQLLQFGVAAVRALGSSDVNPAAHAEFRVPAMTRRAAVFLERSTGTDKNSLSLIIEVGSLVYELKVRVHEFWWTPFLAICKSVEFLHLRYHWTYRIVAGRVGKRGRPSAGRKKEFGHPPKSRAVLKVVFD
jgi:hypothetical protein